MDIKLLLLQIFTICALAWILGWLFAKLHQPRVIGEILAGIILGPSLFGWALPVAAVHLFPPNNLSALYTLSQIGLLLFMFQVGLEVDLRTVRRMGPAVVLTSNISIVLPFAGGAILALFLYDRLSNPSVPLSIFALFIGTALSVTAFPVLARILSERKLLSSRVGLIAISCAAVDDITAWCLLAVIVVKVRSSSGASLWYLIAQLLGYIVFMLAVVRPVVARMPLLNRPRVSIDALSLVLLLSLMSAWTTELIGIHALFGAFFAGVILPKNKGFTRQIVTKLETVTTVLLLPLFFAFTGLRTSVRLLTGDPWLWLYCGLIVLIAVAGKLLGCAITARFTGLSWRDSVSVGLLINTRGLVELVILNIGLDLGVISPTLFAMMVIMALVTTFMTTPLMDLWERLTIDKTVTTEIGIHQKGYEIKY